MPLRPVTSVLAEGLLPIFVEETAPQTNQEAAQRWAEAYSAYVVAGGIPVPPPKKDALAASLTVAFNPTLAGGGIALMIGAFSVFWVGIPVPELAGIASAFVPGASIGSSSLPPNPTPQDQADGLAQLIATLTLSSVTVTQTGSGAQVPLQ